MQGCKFTWAPLSKPELAETVEHKQQSRILAKQAGSCQPTTTTTTTAFLLATSVHYCYAPCPETTTVSPGSQELLHVVDTPDNVKGLPSHDGLPEMENL